MSLLRDLSGPWPLGDNVTTKCIQTVQYSNGLHNDASEISYQFQTLRTINLSQSLTVGYGARKDINTRRKQREYLCFIACISNGFFSFFHQLLGNIMKLSRLLLSSQDSHPGIKLFVLLGSLGSFDLILFCCFHFIYLHLLLTVTLIHVQVHPAFSSHNHKRLSRIISQHVSIQRSEFFGLLATSRLFWKKQLHGGVGVSLSLSIISILNELVPHN